MALTDTFPTQNANGSSLDETRLILAGDVVKSAAGVPRLGILPAHTNALVTGTAGMAYSVAPFNGVGSRTGVGVEKVANDAATSVPTTTAPVANSRIDVIWWRPQFVASADAANVPLFGVTNGTAAGTPSKPAIPAGAFELATAVVLSTTTQTSTTVITQTFQYTTAAGGTLLLRDATEMGLWVPHEGSRAYRLDLAVGATFQSGAWVLDDSGWVTLTVGSGWLANNPPPRIRRQGKVVTLSGVLAYNATGSFNNLFTIPAGYIPASVSGGTIFYIGQANMRIGGGAGTGFTGPLVVTIATGVVQLDLGYSTGSATPTFVTLNGSWVLG